MTNRRCIIMLRYPGLVRIVIGILISGSIMINEVRPELFTSVAELQRWENIEHGIFKLLDGCIEDQTRKLSKLLDLREAFKRSINGTDSQELHLNPTYDISYHKNSMTHPVKAFVVLNRIANLMDDLETILRSGDEDSKYANRDSFETMQNGLGVPSRADVKGTGEAILRLQKFYDLDAKDMIYGSMNDEARHGGGSSEPIMTQLDCLELGKIAYENEDFVISVTWFQEALKLIGMDYRTEDFESSLNLVSHHERDQANEILEYIAFAHYKTGDIPSSLNITILWLKSDPDNDRANWNYEYFSDLLSEDKNVTKEIGSESYDSESVQLPTDHHESLSGHNEDRYILGQSFNQKEYDYTKDDVVRRLCLGKTYDNENHMKIPSEITCTRKTQIGKHFFIPGLDFETIHMNPRIIRIHDIISRSEANYLREKALMKLKRSTVQSSSGLVATDFRIAKTAWLAGELDSIVNSIDDRLSKALGMSMEGSERLQVVNYGLGGYYGPHLDSARELEGEESSLEIDNLGRNDRLATVLIYLDNIESGGSTVFPKLNLTIEPVARSAVVWFNIKPNGYSDDRTLHTGCPVLIGSKWIATKWPREAGNTFSKPCGLELGESWR